MHNKHEDSTKAYDTDENSHENRIVKEIATAVWIIDCTEKPKRIHPMLYDAGCARRIEYKFFQWFDQRRRIKILAVHLPVNTAVCINNRRLRQMVKTLGAGNEMKTDITGN